MSLPFDLTPEDLPVCASLDTASPTMPVVLFDVHGKIRARFVTLEEAQRVVDEINSPQPPELMQEDIHDTGVEPDKAQAQSKEKTMPRGVPKKKRATKKRRAVKQVVKKTAKKTMKKKKRKSRSRYDD